MKKLLIFTTLLCIALYAFPQISSSTSGNWEDGATWVGGTAPTSADDAIIVSPHVVTTTTSGAAGAIVSVNTGATLTINSGATLTTGGNLSVFGTLDQNGTLNVGDALIIDAGIFNVGNGTTTDVATYYKQTNSATISSTSGYSATINLATDGAINDDANPVLAFLDNSIADFNGADVDFNVLDGNNSATMADVIVEAPGTSELSWIGTVTFGSGASTTATDWVMKMEHSTGFYRAAIDIGSSGTFLLEQTTFLTNTRILFNRLALISGSFEIEPLTNLQVSSTSGINITGGSLTLKSDATGSAELKSETIAVTAKAEQFIVGEQWHQITPITTGTTTADVFQNNNPQVWLMEWDVNGSPQNWQYIVDPELDDALNVGQGYIVKSDLVSRDYDFTIEYNGNLKVDNYNKPSYSATEGDFELVGNPFSSSLKVIDGVIGLYNATNLDNDIWVWNPATDNYATATGGAGGTHPGVVAPGQCFFVRASSTNPTTLLLEKDDRTFWAGNNFYKKSSLIDWSDNFGIGEYVMLKVSDGEKQDAAFINFGESGSDDFESNYDGYKRFGSETAPQLYLVEGDYNLSIDYLKTLGEAEEKIVQLNFKAGQDTEHIIAANLDSLLNTKVTLEDLKTGMMHEFNNGDHYVFNASTNDDNDRFLLHFLYSPTGIEDPIDQGTVENTIKVYAFNNAVYISNKDNNISQSTVAMYDLLGRQIYSNKIELGSSTRIPVNVSNTYLIVKVIKGNEVITQKVFVQ